MIEGSCLCGAIGYEALRLSSPIGLCHCRTCQKAHASAYAPTARAHRSEFRWTRGADLVAGFESSPGKIRHFCPRCGTHLMAEWVTMDQVIVRVGSIDTPLDERPAVHIWMSQASPWLEPAAGMPRLPEGRAS
jgi:hypothetical protein